MGIQEIKRYYGSRAEDADVIVKQASNQNNNSTVKKIIFHHLNKGWAEDEIWRILPE